MYKNDLTNKRFGRLVVLEYTNRKTKNNTCIWKCKCDCGNIKYVATNDLNNGHVRSCGCLARDVSSGIGKKRAGLTYEEIYGIERAKQEREKRRGEKPWLLGRVPWNKGLTKKHPKIQAAIEKMKKHPNIGQCHTREVKEKIRQGNIGKHNGEKNGMWKGGITKPYMRFFSTSEYPKWRMAVLRRDNFTCQSCGKRGGDFHVHHIVPRNISPDENFNIDNGATLCKACHDRIHREEY